MLLSAKEGEELVELGSTRWDVEALHPGPRMVHGGINPGPKVLVLGLTLLPRGRERGRERERERERGRPSIHKG